MMYIIYPAMKLSPDLTLCPHIYVHKHLYVLQLNQKFQQNFQASRTLDTHFRTKEIRKISKRKKVTWHKCHVCQATSAKFKDRRFFRFPSDIERCKEWIEILKMTQLQSVPLESLHKRYRICSIHFNDTAYATSKRKYLKQNAIPIQTVDLHSIKILNVAQMSEKLRIKFQAALSSAPSGDADGISSNNLSNSTETLQLYKEGMNSTSEQKNDDQNSTGNEEAIIPDVEMQCSESTEMETQNIASTNFSDNSDIVIKQEIIETELEPSTFDDSSFHSSFADGPSETHIDGQRPSTSYATHSESSYSNTDILPDGQPYGVGEDSTPSQGLGTVKVETAVSFNSSGVSDKNDPSSSILNASESSKRDKSMQPSVSHSVINVTRSENLPIIEHGVSSHTGSSSLPQGLNNSGHGRAFNNESTQPEVPSYSSQSFRPRDNFDVFGEFIASKLRNLDPKSRDFVQNTFADLISKAELGMFSNKDYRSISATQSQDRSQFPKGSENAQASSGKENIQPVIPSHMKSPHLPSDFSILSHESSSLDRINQPSHIKKSSFPPLINNTITEPIQSTVTSNVESLWPPGLSRSFSEITPTFNPTQNRISSHAVLPPVPPVLNAANSWCNMPIQPKVPFHQRSRDEFDIYGDFVASKLRKLDPRSCVFVQTAFADIIFKAELGRFVREGNKSNDFLQNMHATNAVGSQKNIVSNLSSYEGQRRFCSTSSELCDDQVPLEMIPNMHSIRK
nr:uncharacterized protein LOC107450749 isoform X1 [Parasteatoda tepidariorum]